MQGFYYLCIYKVSNNQKTRSMKTLKIMSLIMTLCLAMGFSACRDDDYANLKGISQIDLIGTWELAPIDKNVTMTDASIWTFCADNTCTCLVGERGITVSYTYQLMNHGQIVQLTASDGSVINFQTGKLGRDQIVWQEIPGSGGTRIMHKLVRLVAD